MGGPSMARLGREFAWKIEKKPENLEEVEGKTW
jgi:hypothetical protein